MDRRAARRVRREEGRRARATEQARRAHAGAVPRPPARGVGSREQGGRSSSRGEPRGSGPGSHPRKVRPVLVTSSPKRRLLHGPQLLQGTTHQRRKSPMGSRTNTSRCGMTVPALMATSTLLLTACSGGGGGAGTPGLARGRAHGHGALGLPRGPCIEEDPGPSEDQQDRQGQRGPRCTALGLHGTDRRAPRPRGPHPSRSPRRHSPEEEGPATEEGERTQRGMRWQWVLFARRAAGWPPTGRRPPRP